MVERRDDVRISREGARDMLNTWNESESSSTVQVTASDAPRAYRAIFFDLDGTLLPMELEEFLGTYFESIAGFVAKHCRDVASFSQGLKAGIGAMTMHEDGGTNSDAFWNEFFRHVEGDSAEWMSLLMDFYENEFGAIGAKVVPNPATARAIETLAAKGYPLVLATMPMFPQRAVEWRLNWAGVNPARFERLTTFENSTSVKPKSVYYAENLAACGLTGADVLMVGNNTVEDLAACKLGTDAFLIMDHVLDPVGFDVETVKHGTMEEFAAWVETLPACANPAASIEAGEVSATAREAVLSAAQTAAQAGVED